MEIHLHRSNRTVVMTGPDRTLPSVLVSNAVIDRLTYYTRNYVRVGNGGSYDTVERRLYLTDSQTGFVQFPLGLLPAVAGFLTTYNRHAPVIHGVPLAELDPHAHHIDVDAVLREFEIYEGQDEALAAVAGSDGGQITASTGWGKGTLIVMICLMYPNARIHVTTKSADIARSLYTRLAAVLPSVGFIGAGSMTRGRVTVFVADSLHHGNGDANILLSDECHELVSPKYARSLGMYRTARMFGFTATPTGRHDGRDPEIEALFGPILYTLTYQQSQAAGRVVPMTVEWLRIPSGPTVTGLDPVIRERIGVWRNDERNQTIADRVRLIPADEQTLIITSTIDHAVRLRARLPEYTLCYAQNGMDQERLTDYQDLGLLPSTEEVMTKKRRETIRTEFAANRLKKVIANYVWSTGVDFPFLTHLIRADAGGRGKTIKAFQIPGRACRHVAGIKESATIIDCWDEWDDTMLDRSRYRRRLYQAQGWAQIMARAAPPRK
jgi:superfamily II DNA or RNA helicase